MKSILVTGATGALGRAVIAHLHNSGVYQVIATKRQPDKDPASVLCDIRYKDQLAAAFGRAKPDIVLHLAAAFSEDLNQAYAVNVAPARNILDLVQNTAIGTRVVLIGSAAEYGVVQPDENPVREDRVLAPVSVYGVSKAWQTQLVGLYNSRGVDVVCARIFNLYGMGISDRLFAGRLQNQIAAIAAGKRSMIEVGPLAAIRDYVSTEEASLQLLVVTAYGESGGIYHVASGQPVTMREFLMRQLNACGLDLSVVKESPSLSNRSGYDVPAIYADITKTKQLEKAGRKSV